MLSMQIGIHHSNDGFRIGQIADDDRDSRQTKQGKQKSTDSGCAGKLTGRTGRSDDQSPVDRRI